MSVPIGYVANKEDAAARVAYLFSESVISIQPSLKSAPAFGFQHGLEQMVTFKSRGLISKKGTYPEIVRARHNADPFLTVLNELSNKSFISVTTTSHVLPEGLSYLTKLVKFPVVIHVSMSRAFPDYFEITSLRNLGFVLLQSFSLREAQDMAIAAHLLAIRSGRAVIHFFDQSEINEDPIPFENVEALERVLDKSSFVYRTDTIDVKQNLYWNDIAGVAERSDLATNKQSEHGMDGINDTIKQLNSNEDLNKAVDAIFELVRSVTGRIYKYFDYHGVANADTALFIFGSSVQRFTSTISQAGWGEVYSKVGVITVRVYRPWSMDRFLAAIPKSVKRLGVLEQYRRLNAKWSPLLLDVVSSLNGDLSRPSSIPVVVGYQLGYLDGKTIHQALRGIIQNIQSPNPIQSLSVGSSLPHDIDNEYSLVQPVLETAYTKMLTSVFGSSLNIINQLESSNIISKRISNSPEYGLGVFLAKEEEREVFIKRLELILKDKLLDDETLQLISRWLLLNGEKSADLNDAATILIDRLKAIENEISKEILKSRNFLVPQNTWIITSDAWSYDLGSSGVHHLISSGKNVNMLVIDSQPFTTRTQQDAARRKKDIGLYAMNYSNTYVASIAVYSSYTQSVQALIEAEKFEGPSIILAYLPYEMETDSPLEVLQETKKAVDAGYWPLYRWDPRYDDAGSPSFQLDSEVLKSELKKFLDRENHLSQLARRAAVFDENISGSYGSEIRSKQQQKAKDAYVKLVEGLTGPPLTILFASDGGSAENVAKRLQRRAKGRGLGSVALAMDDFPLEDLAAEENVVFITSTAGQGEFPQNGRNFWESLKSTNDLDLASTKYAVFGMGDSHYWPRKQDKIYYNKPSKDLSHRLEILGGKVLIPLGLGDDQDPDGYQTAYGPWEDDLWKALGVDGVGANVDDPPPMTNEDIKIQSNYLRGTIVQGLRDESTGAISANDSQLTKFHGTYMQDDRDIRDQRKAAGLEPAYSFMIRVRMPSGVSTPAQWIAMDDLAEDKGNHTFKMTTRGTYQLHGVIKKNLKATIKAINVALLDTIAACGDVNRNVMCAGLPYNHVLHTELHEYSKKISLHLLPKTTAYHEIWLTDDNDEKTLVGGDAVVDFEPLYGPTYLPRKFKIAIACPPYNDVDVYANDVGLIAIVDSENRLVGFNVLAGGGMGTTHNNKKTYPRTGSILGYVSKEDVVIVCEKIMLVQRDNGDRKDRKHARLKYTIDDLGVDVFRGMVEDLWGKKFEQEKPFFFESNIDHFGWIKDERGLNHYTMFIENGRVENTAEFQMKTGLRKIAEAMTGEAEFRLTGNQHVILSNISNENLIEIKRLMKEYNLDNLNYSALRLSSSACVAFPTCGLAMAESERYLPIFVSKLETYLEELGLRHDSVIMRMTGCPNGCARPWLAEVALVGKAYGAYNLMLGGGYHGQRLNKLYRSSINEQQALEILRPLFKRWSLEREEGEHFGDFLIRAGVIKPTLSGKTFHDDIPEEDE
ncbi:hypothetical protein V1511DRAFT_518789 [Dipodascopsis uninucleata]